MIDHIGSKKVALRRSEFGITIRLLDTGKILEFNAEEWSDLVGLVVAIKAAVEYTYMEES